MCVLCKVSCLLGIQVNEDDIGSLLKHIFLLSDKILLSQYYECFYLKIEDSVATIKTFGCFLELICLFYTKKLLLFRQNQKFNLLFLEGSSDSELKKQEVLVRISFRLQLFLSFREKQFFLEFLINASEFTSLKNVFLAWLLGKFKISTVKMDIFAALGRFFLVEKIISGNIFLPLFQFLLKKVIAFLFRKKPTTSKSIKVHFTNKKVFYRHFLGIL